jgi:TM2 domain-containing membrane protein YozV
LEKQPCPACGGPTPNPGQLCPNCDAKQRDIFAGSNQGASQNQPPKDNSRWLITLLLCWFLGVFGVHRFYTGHIGIGIAQLLTLGGCGIWSFIDLIIILVGNYKDSDGNPIKA